VSRFLLAWELGGNLGHIKPLLALALELRKRGHEVTFAVRDIAAAASVLQEPGFAFLQAPALGRRPADAPRDPASYAEILHHCGFTDAAGLAVSLQAWRHLYRLVQPDAIVFDHSPCALLAARGLGIPRILFGTGFASPPRVSPLPSFRPWTDVPPERLQSADQRVLEACNAALATLGAGPMQALHELFDVEENLLATLPELDHYPDRKGAKYWGPVYDDGTGETPHWPEGTGKKVFVYIRPKSPAFPELARVLRDTDARVLWFAPGLAPKESERLQTDRLRFAHQPLNITNVAAEADAAVIHGGHGTAAAMLVNGVPVLVAPETVEQFIVSRKIESAGKGFIVLPQKLRAHLHSGTRRLLGSARCVNSNSDPQCQMLAKMALACVGNAVEWHRKRLKEEVA
jgi:UDP:flavonoid glycosyltransferase YjiC (YdhE family)